MVDDINVDAPTMRAPLKANQRPKGSAPMKQPGKYPCRLTDEEWAAIHSSEPKSVYKLRPLKRPLQGILPGTTCDTPNGDFGSVKTVEESCENCGAQVVEVFRPSGELRCLGCGRTPPIA